MNLRAEIWQYTPGSRAWKMVYRAPDTIRNPAEPRKHLASDIGYRGMVDYTDPKGREAIYAGRPDRRRVPAPAAEEPPAADPAQLRRRPLAATEPSARGRALPLREPAADGLSLTGRMEGPPVRDRDTGPDGRRSAVRGDAPRLPAPGPGAGQPVQPGHLRRLHVRRPPLRRLRERQDRLLGVGDQRHRNHCRRPLCAISVHLQADRDRGRGTRRGR